MKKRMYQQPTQQVVELQVRNQLLSVSSTSGTGGFGGDPEEEDMSARSMFDDEFDN